jgi:hypothetical protein
VGIAYNFDLKMNEENDIGTTIDVLGGWAPKFNLALPIHDDLRFRAFAAFGTSGRTGSFGFFTA